MTSPVELMQHAAHLVNALQGHQGPDAQRRAALIFVGICSPEAGSNKLAVAVKAVLRTTTLVA